MTLQESIKGKNVLFITTHRISYIRCTQELEIIKQESCDYKALYSNTGNHLLSALKIWLWLLFHPTKKYDVVVVSYMAQLIVPFVGWRIKGFLIVDFFISLYDSLVFDRKKIQEGSITSKLVHYLDKRSVDKAGLVIADTKAHAGFFSSEFGIRAEKMEVLYLKADKTLYYPMQVDRLKEWENKYLVIYFGTVIPLQGVETVLKAIEITQSDPDVHFIFIGPLSSECRRDDLRNVSFINWVEQDELARYIAMSDLCLAGHFNGEIKKADRTIPTKAYIYEAMGKQMVLGDSKANHELFEEDRFHRYVKMGDAEKLAQKILEIKKESKAAQEVI